MTWRQRVSLVVETFSLNLVRHWSLLLGRKRSGYGDDMAVTTLKAFHWKIASYEGVLRKYNKIVIVAMLDFIQL